jgi:hypothetical protein
MHSSISKIRPPLALGRSAFLFCALACSLPLSFGRAIASDAVFTVANYPVEARADNAVAAKERALADGQQAAFRSLLRRLVPVTAHQRLRRLPQVSAAELVEGVRVRSERNSATEYLASLDFAFQAKPVRDLLRREGIPFLDEQAHAVTLIPIWRADAARPPSDDPTWSNVWRGLDLEHALTPVKLQTLKKEIRPEAVSGFTAGEPGAIRTFAAQYGTEHILVALAEPDAAASRLNVVLSGRDAVGAFTLKRAYRLDVNDPAYARELAAVIALGVLEGRWKAIKVRGAGATPATAAESGRSDLQIAVEFRGMSEWQDISRRLGLVAGVEDLDVAGLSARGARITLRYAGGPERLADAVSQHGLALRNAGGSWVLGLR